LRFAKSATIAAMKRDMELVRKILPIVEEDGRRQGYLELSAEDRGNHTPEEVSCHVKSDVRIN